MQFAPTDPALLERLPVLDRPVRLTSIASTQLRMEGIDALEVHYEGSHQPRPLADRGRDALMDRIGLSPLEYRPPGLTRVTPPAVNDGQPGWIASRSLDIHGRPVAWLFTSDPPVADGEELFLDEDQVRASVNHAQLVAGAAYPLLYGDPTTTSPGIFVGLANRLRVPAVQAAGSRCPYVQEDDRTIAGLPATVRRHQPCPARPPSWWRPCSPRGTAATSSSFRSRNRPAATGRTGC